MTPSVFAHHNTTKRGQKMHKFTTLVATDFSKSSFIVLSKALEFTQKTGGVMHVVHVAEHSVFSFKKNLDSIRVKSFNKLKEAFPSIGDDYFHCVAGKVKTEVANVAKEVQADLIILGQSGETYFLDELILGSHTKDIVRHCETPVLVIKNVHELEYDTILIPTDLSEASAKTIHEVTKLFPKSHFKILNFYYLPFQTRLDTYGLDEEEMIAYQNTVKKESQESLDSFVASLALSKEISVSTYVKQSSLNAKLFTDEVKEIEHDLVAIHTTGSLSFYAFDVLEHSQKDVIIVKQDVK